MEAEKKKHHPMSPSGAHRWMRCPGSVRLIAQHNLPDEESPEAAEGTRAHELRARMLMEPGYNPNGEWPDEMIEAVSPGVATTLAATRDADNLPIMVEWPVPLNDVATGCSGTVDSAFFFQGEEGESWLFVDDFKYGRVPVSAEWNPQLALYAMGIIKATGSGTPDFIRMNIDQPRAGGGSWWTVSYEKLEEYYMTILEAARVARTPDAPLVPGEEQCRYCPVRSLCPALGASMAETLSLATTGEWTPPALSPAMVRAVLLAKPRIEKWLEDVSKRAHEAALAGTPPPGMKLVEGRRSNRRWADEAAARDVLRDALGAQAYAVKLISPSEAERLLDDASLMPPTVQLPGAPKLVDESEKGKPWGAPCSN